MLFLKHNHFRVKVRDVRDPTEQVMSHKNSWNVKVVDVYHQWVVGPALSDAHVSNALVETFQKEVQEWLYDVKLQT